MKLAVSNIAWPASVDQAALQMLQSSKIRAIEVAPTRLWPNWQEASIESAIHHRGQLSSQGFLVSSLQAILFGRPDCRLFGSAQERSALHQHLDLCGDLAVALGAKNLVFGAPKNRDMSGLTPDQAFDLAVQTFRFAGQRYQEKGICLCLEANPQQYGCNFVINSSEAAALVREVDSPSFRLHLDTACMYLAGEDLSTSLEDNFDILRHFHASEPELATFDYPKINHSCVAQVLKRLGYAHWISLEMRATDDPLRSLEQSVQFVAAHYGNDL